MLLLVNTKFFFGSIFKIRLAQKFMPILPMFSPSIDIKCPVYMNNVGANYRKQKGERERKTSRYCITSIYRYL